MLDPCLEYLAQKRFVTFRINRLKAHDALSARLFPELGVQPHPLNWPPHTFSIRSKHASMLSHSRAFETGLIYIQELSSIASVYILGAQPGEHVLDLCAGPGGKTALLAECMENRGHIAAVEPVKSRFFRLKATLDRCGVHNTRCFRMDGRKAHRHRPEAFDRVLLDAPCSTEGGFRMNHPKSFRYWSKRKIFEMQRKQKGLLFSAVQCLKPHGRLLYCTCTFAPEENEEVVSTILSRFKSTLEVLPIHLPIANVQPGLLNWEGKAYDPQVKRCLRILPNDLWSPFFLCLMRKKESTVSA